MKNEIEIKYKLPRDWEKTADISFVQLSDFITQLHDSAYTAAVKAVNRFATIRNYMIGFYIVEYEQHGSDRAKYGDKLLRRLAERVNKRGINETLLKVARAFYLAYPQVKDYLLGKTAELIGNFEKSATASHQFKIPAEKLISQLSFSHIREILTVDNPLARFFYEIECIKCCWSVKELRRQVATNLYFRSGLSKKPELLLKRSQTLTEPAMTIKDPFFFEFLDLRPESLTESDLENALITHLQEFMLELGKGFCLEARQKRMIIDDEYYYADLVFYNRILHCNVIVELKDDEFKHSDLSQLNAYVSYFRENEMRDGDNPPVGILLCTKKGKKMVDYALAGLDNKLFVSSYMLSLPDEKVLEEFIIKEIEG